MTTYDFVHLVIHAGGDAIHGRTCLQNLVYFSGVLSGYQGQFGFRPHFYGPYSADVTGAIQDLRGLRFLKRIARRPDPREPKGFELTSHEYVLTEEGKQVAEQKSALFPSAWEKIVHSVRRITQSNAYDYIRLTIAAKTHLIIEHTHQSLSRDDLRQLITEHGWRAFSTVQYEEALKFLDLVGLVPVTVRR